MTRAGMVWVAVSVGLVLLVLLIIFILQNQDRVNMQYLGVTGELSLGIRRCSLLPWLAGFWSRSRGQCQVLLQLRIQRRREAGQPLAPAGPSTIGPPPPTSGT